MTSTDCIQVDRSIDMEGDLQSTLSSTTDSIVDAYLPNVLKCFICLEPPTDPISTSCGHIFCWPCMYQWLQNRPKPCPVCRYTLRRDLDIIPLYGGGGAREEPGNGNGHPGEAAASPSFPPRPRNPLLVTATASADDAMGFDDLFSVTPSSVLAGYQRSINDLCYALNVEIDRAHDMETMGIDLLAQKETLEREIGILRRQLEQKDWQQFLERHQKLQRDGRINELERRNLVLVREAEASQAKERQLFKRGMQMGEHLARLQERLDRADQQLPPGWRKGL